MNPAADEVIGLYERHALAFDADRSRSLREKPWLDQFLTMVPAQGRLLDLGCGAGEPIGRYLITQGRQVTGVDSAPSLIGLCEARFPGQEWLTADIRSLNLCRKFDGVLAWNSVFHLTPDDQRSMFQVYRAHTASGAPLMFTSGGRAGEAIGDYRGDPLYHSSLDPADYRALLVASGFTVVDTRNDQALGEATVWLAQRL